MMVPLENWKKDRKTKLRSYDEKETIMKIKEKRGERSGLREKWNMKHEIEKHEIDKNI